MQSGQIQFLPNAPWYVLLLGACRELATCHSAAARDDDPPKLTQRGYTSYCPIACSRVPTGRITSAGRKEMRDRRSALFPGYGFVSFPSGEENWPDLEKVPGVRGKLTMDGSVTGQPAQIPGPLIEAIVARELGELARYGQAVRDAERVRTRAPYVAGQRVVVTEGPFADFLARVDQTDAKGRVRLLLSLFGRQVGTWLDGEVLRAA